MNLRKSITDYCMSLGIKNIGFIKCRRFEELKEFYEDRKKLGLENEFEEIDIEKRINPNIYMNEGKTIISIAFPYLYESDYIDNGFSLYTRGNDYHRVVKKYLDKICEFIEALGGKTVALVDSNTLPERYIAYLAEVGFIGKNNMIITKDYGSYVFLGEIITDLEIECKERRVLEDISYFKECGICEECYNACPSKAINKLKKNCNICISYLTQKKDLDDSFINLLNGRLFGCDTCQKQCPYNKEILFSNIEEFKPYLFMNEDNTDFLIKASNKEFKESFYKTSCGWRGKNVLKRNAIIKRYNEGENIRETKVDSPYLQKYIDKLMIINENK